MIEMITFAPNFLFTKSDIGVQLSRKLYSQINVYKFGSY